MNRGVVWFVAGLLVGIGVYQLWSSSAEETTASQRPRATRPKDAAPSSAQDPASVQATLRNYLHGRGED